MGDNDLGSVRPCVFASVRPRFVCPRFVRLDEYLQHQWIFFPDTLHIHLLQSAHGSCEVSSWSNSKWPTYRHFCLLKLTKYLKMLFVRMNISNTNEHFFPILYTCINYYPPMNPVKLSLDQIHNGWLIAIFVCSNWQNIWKIWPSRWISPTPMHISSWYSTHALNMLNTILLWILWSVVRIKFKIADLLPFLFAQIDKIFENIVHPDKYRQHQWIFFSDSIHMH